MKETIFYDVIETYNFKEPTIVATPYTDFQLHSIPTPFRVELYVSEWSYVSVYTISNATPFRHSISQGGVMCIHVELCVCIHDF